MTLDARYVPGIQSLVDGYMHYKYTEHRVKIRFETWCAVVGENPSATIRERMTLQAKDQAWRSH
jgi:hypothetical protein